ncbi:MAG: hypothetical protein GC181_03935 [Bacteroidetes bacterium]|nr:hypothetical protein [Bacteroidota bacterium]
MKLFRTLSIALCFTGIVTTSKAQNNTSTDLQDRFFVAFHSSTYLDFAQSPLRFENVWTGNVDVSGNKIFVNAPIQSFNINLFSFGLEPRLNLQEFDKNSALAVSSPFSIGLGNSVPTSNSVIGVEGIGSIQIPILLKMYVGSGSTYTCEKDFGISFGGGLEFNKIGLISMQDQNTSSAASRKGWVMPVATLGIHFWRGYNPVEFNIKYGRGTQKEYVVDRYGNPIEDSNGFLSSVKTQSYTFRMSISYLLNY